MPEIARLIGREILDSRGRPTVAATCQLSSGTTASASVPSGASTGSAEALELRDGDPLRYRGLGCRKASDHINNEIQHSLAGQSFDSQIALDQALIRLDGTSNKARLGANAILAVSLAYARACAVNEGLPLFQYFSKLIGMTCTSLPRLTVNLFSGGKHAGGQVDIQDVLIVPSSSSIDEGLSQVYAVYQAAAALIQRKYGMRPLTADEGGLAPAFQKAEDMLADAVQAIEHAGLVPGKDIALAVDVASSHFYQDGIYRLDNQPVSSLEMIETLKCWVKQYPIISVEDGLAEEDWPHWPELSRQLSDHTLIMGDDFLCTNPVRIQRAVGAHAANALLLKANQIGTLTEAAEAYLLARSAGWKVTISARSGETEDDWLADLAVGWSADYIKVGSITHSERLAKYNRLLSIEQMASHCAKTSGLSPT